MRVKFLLLIIYFMQLNFCFAGNNDDRYSFVTAAQSVRFNQLTEELRCVVCQGQNLADSYAPIALDIKDKIRDLIISDQTDQQIKGYLVRRYGEYILLKPSWSLKTYFLWIFPFLGLSVILVRWVTLTRSLRN